MATLGDVVIRIGVACPLLILCNNNMHPRMALKTKCGFKQIL